MIIFLIIATLMLVQFLEQNQVAGKQCPSSDSPVHASCVVTITFGNSCDAVRNEIKARVDGQSTGAWIDPHNNGTYSILAASDDLYSLKRLTGDEKYTDLIDFTFEGSQDACTVEACSVSQVFSIGDAGTNFCNSYDLYCNEDGCHPFSQLDYTYTVGKCTESSPKKCLVV